MHKPRIIFFDIDGTLIDMEKKRITERTLDALRRLQQNGILPVSYTHLTLPTILRV